MLSFKPEESVRSSILRTHKLCLSEMKMFKKTSTSRRLPELAHGCHATVSSASDLLRVNYDERKGRYLEVNIIKSFLFSCSISQGNDCLLYPEKQIWKALPALDLH